MVILIISVNIGRLRLLDEHVSRFFTSSVHVCKVSTSRKPSS